MAKIKVNPNDTLAQEALDKHLKVYTHFSPYFSKDTQVEVKLIEQVEFFHKKIGETRVLGEFVKDKKIRKGKRKRVVKDLIKYWDKDFKNNMELQQQEMLKTTKNIKKKRIRKIGMTFVYLFGIICLAGVFLSQRMSFLKHISFIKNFISNFYDMLDHPIYNNLLIVLTYLSLFTLFYLIFLKTYFDILRKVGYNAETFIKKEFVRIHNSFINQQKKVKKHLLRSISKYYKQKYHINKIFDPNIMIGKLEKYSQYVEDKVVIFRKKYHWLLLSQFLLKLCVLGIASYLGYVYYMTYV